MTVSLNLTPAAIVEALDRYIVGRTRYRIRIPVERILPGGSVSATVPRNGGEHAPVLEQLEEPPRLFPPPMRWINEGSRSLPICHAVYLKRGTRL